MHAWYDFQVTISDSLETKKKICSFEQRLSEDFTSNDLIYISTKNKNLNQQNENMFFN